MDLPVLITDTAEQLPDPQAGLRRGSAPLQVSMLFMGRMDAPAHLGSFSRALLCYKGSVCKAGGVGWGVLHMRLSGQQKQL